MECSLLICLFNDVVLDQPGKPSSMIGVSRISSQHWGGHSCIKWRKIQNINFFLRHYKFIDDLSRFGMSNDSNLLDKLMFIYIFKWSISKFLTLCMYNATHVWLWKSNWWKLETMKTKLNYTHIPCLRYPCNSDHLQRSKTSTQKYICQWPI